MALDGCAANILARYPFFLTQFYSKNRPPKSAPKFGAIFTSFVPLKPSSFPRKRHKKKKRCFSFETCPKCRRQIGLKAIFSVEALVSWVGGSRVHNGCPCPSCFSEAISAGLLRFRVPSKLLQPASPFFKFGDCGPAGEAPPYDGEEPFFRPGLK